MGKSMKGGLYGRRTRALARLEKYYADALNSKGTEKEVTPAQLKRMEQEIQTLKERTQGKVVK